MHNGNIILLYTYTTEMYFLVYSFNPQLYILLCKFLGDSFGIRVKCTYVDSAISKCGNANSNTRGDGGRSSWPGSCKNKKACCITLHSPIYNNYSSQISFYLFIL